MSCAKSEQGCPRVTQAPSGGIRLHGGGSFLERLQAQAGGLDGRNQWPFRQIHLEAARTLDLWNQVDIGEARTTAKTEIAPMRVSGQQGLEGVKTSADPVRTPVVDGRFVGLELMEPEKKLRGGAILFASDDEIKGHGRGYITSVTWSTELNKFIALGLYQGGLKHEGEEIIAAFPLKNEQAKLRIVSPHFIDKEGARLHA